MGICLPSGALNFNYEGDRAEQELRGISFDIADERTVRRLMIEETDLLRYDNLFGESGQLDVSSFAKGMSYTNILDHEYMHCLCNSNGWIEDKVISAIEKVAKELGLKSEKFISDEISIYASGQTGFGSRQETVAEVFSKLNGKDAAIAEKIFKEAGLI